MCKRVPDRFSPSAARVITRDEDLTAGSTLKTEQKQSESRTKIEKTAEQKQVEKMSKITEHVGDRIRRARKGRGLTIEEFARMINKSKATVSKYESGSITVDIETLLDIADALDMELKSLIDYHSPNVKSRPLPQNSFFNQQRYYVYNYDGRIKDVVRSLIEIHRPPDDDSPIDAHFYMGLNENFNTEKAQHIFEGTMTAYDTITHINLVNQINMTEQVYLCILNPMHANSPAVGILSGIASSPFFAPVAIKILVSKKQIREDTLLHEVIELNKEDSRTLRYYNMMVINRPTPMELNDK